MSQDQPLMWKSNLGGPVYLVATESLGISKVGQTVLARLMMSQIWHQLASSLGRGFRKGKWPLLSLMPDTSVPPFMPLVPFKLLPWCWSPEGVSLSR